MRHYLTLTVLLTCAAISGSLSAQTDDIEHMRTELAKLARAELNKGVASISIALVRDGEIVLTDAWGYSNVWTRSPATPDTLYCTGSTFKAVTATALLQLEERGKLSLDDPANSHLGDHPITADIDNTVTVRQLLDHTSGLQPGAQNIDIWKRTLPKTLEELPGGLSMVTTPGTAWAYNNHAYGIAGLIIEKVSGLSYEQYILEHVLTPLGVTTPRPIHPTPDMMQRFAMPYTTGPNAQPQPAPLVHFDVYPAGDVYLTAEDMARFLAAHLNDGVFRSQRILSPASVDDAHKPNLNNYALGWGVQQETDRTLISHGGGVPGFLTFMIGDVDAGVGAYVMSNSGDMTGIGHAAINLLAGRHTNTQNQPPSERAAIELPEGTLKQYLGSYDVADSVLTIELSDSTLWGELSDGQRFEIFAEAEDRLFLRVVDAQLRILRDAKGTVTGFILFQNGQHFEAMKRIE